MRLFPPPHVHAVGIDADIVFLDVLADTYFCLAGAVAHARATDGGAFEVDNEDAAHSLVEAGLLVEEPGAPRVPPPPLPRAGLVGRPAKLTPGRLTRAVRANASAARAVAALPFASLVALAAREAARQADRQPFAPATLVSSVLLAEARQFERLVPWLPRTGVCLMRSLQTLLYLRALGFRPQWVFGVRTWPFQAHCWLQAGEHVLDDHVEHVRAYAPIMAI